MLKKYMACRSYGVSTEKPITKKQTEVWLIGQVLSKLNATPQKMLKKILKKCCPQKMKYWHCFYTISKLRRKQHGVQCHATAENILEVWRKAHLPARLHKHVVDKEESSGKN